MGDLYGVAYRELDLEGSPDWLSGDLAINLDRI